MVTPPIYTVTVTKYSISTFYTTSTSPPVTVSSTSTVTVNSTIYSTIPTPSGFVGAAIPTTSSSSHSSTAKVTAAAKIAERGPHTPFYTGMSCTEQIVIYPVTTTILYVPGQTVTQLAATSSTTVTVTPSALAAKNHARALVKRSPDVIITSIIHAPAASTVTVNVVQTAVANVTVTSHAACATSNQRGTTFKNGQYIVIEQLLNAADATAQNHGKVASAAACCELCFNTPLCAASSFGGGFCFLLGVSTCSAQSSNPVTYYTQAFSGTQPYSNMTVGNGPCGYILP
ncbi:hypothetical protein MBLNU459_g3830t2 [Dothideomycetes sp. NU459]